MTKGLDALRSFYGAGPLHLLATLASLLLAGYVVLLLGPTALWDTSVWWQSILVWFVGAVVVHDFVLFPLYAMADRALTAVTGMLRARRGSAPLVSPLNYVRVPALATGLTFLLFLPGIIQQGANSYLSATGQTQDPFLERWLLLSLAAFALSALAYAIRSGVTRSRSRGG